MMDPVELKADVYSSIIRKTVENISTLVTSANDSEDDLTEAPHVFTLHRNTPNPFNSSTVIGFILTRAMVVRLIVYDLLGREIAVLADERCSAGDHTVYWNGRDTRGDPVSAGVYVYRLEACGKAETRRMLLMR